MTIASTTSKVSYNGSGSTGPFPITFKFTKNADIVATKRSSAGVETALALTTDYTLTGAGDASGGALTLVVALAVGESLVIARVPGIVQEVDYVENSAFPAEAHEGALDLLTMICQSLQEQVDRSVKVEISSTTSPDALLDELAADVASAAASAATATTQAGLANTARIAAELAETNAEAAAASIPTFGAFGLTLAATTTASNARAALELGTAALVDTGTGAGDVVQLGEDGALPAVSGANLTNLPGGGSACVGLFSKLRGSTTGLSAVVTITADELVVEDSSNAYKTLRAVSVTPSLATSGENGLDTGTSAGSTWYSVWVIAKEDGTTAGLLSLSGTAPTMPTGYTFKARVWSVRTDATANRYPLRTRMADKATQYATAVGTNLTAYPIMISGVQGNLTAPVRVAASTAAFIPAAAYAIEVSLSWNGSASSAVGPNDAYGTLTSANIAPMGSNIASAAYGAIMGRFVLESTNIYYSSDQASDAVRCIGWEE